MTEYMTETKFRNAVRKVLGSSVRNKSDRWSRWGIHVDNAEGHWEKDATHFRVKSTSPSHWGLSQLDIERKLVMAGFEMVEWRPEYAYDTDGVHIAWRKAA
jgi:hypothetical protein